MNIIDDSINILIDLSGLLNRISEKEYSQCSELLFNASIGQHCRHIIEFFQCLNEQQQNGNICYDLRKRNQLLERSAEAGLKAIEELKNWLAAISENCALKLYVSHDLNPENPEHEIISSSLYRELAFNVEHAIHHMAIIKIGLRAMKSEIELPEDFGVAPSTIRFRKAGTN